MPSASEADATGKWAERALAARPDLAAAFERALAAADVESLQKNDSEAFAALGEIVSGAYYMNVKVRKRIGYPGQKSNPPFPDEADYYLEGLLPERDEPLPDRRATAPHVKTDSPANVLVIGAGASGAVAAKELAEAGFSVVCLEQGGWKNASDFPGDKLEFELLVGKEWNANPNVRGWPEDYPCETSESEVDPVMFNAVGGSTIHFGAQWARMRPADFRTRSLEGVGDDWPISYDELLPSYERLDIDMNVSGIGGDPAYPPGAPPPLPPLSIGKIGRKAAEGMNKLGWHWWPAAHAIPSQATATQAPCARRGTCMFGCPEGAKDPYMSVLGLYDEDLESWLGPWGTPLLSLQFADTDESRGFPRGAQWDVMPIGGPLMALARYDALPFEERWGPSVHGLVEKTLGRAFDWGIGIEDLPSEANVVALDRALTDSDGIPAPQIRYRIDEDAKANLAWQLERAKEAHEAAGAVESVVTDWSQWGWHLLGTCRMGDDPLTSVVDRFGRAHDVPNLYIVDGSVFVTSGPQPPTATIAANAHRCVEHLIQTASPQAVPA